MLGESTETMESESTSGVQLKRKPGRLRQDRSKLPLTKPSTVLDDAPTQEPSIAPTSTMVTPDLGTGKRT